MASKKTSKTKTQKKVEKYVKKLPLLVKVVAVILFVVAAFSSFVVANTIQKNDRFELVGEKVITLNVGGTYTEPELDQAIECISFGRDAIDTVSINESETTYDPLTSTQKEGTYYIVYQTSDFKYSSITRIRTIIVSEVEVNEDGIGE